VGAARERSVRRKPVAFGEGELNKLSRRAFRLAAHSARLAHWRADKSRKTAGRCCEFAVSYSKFEWSAGRDDGPMASKIVPIQTRSVLRGAALLALAATLSACGSASAAPKPTASAPPTVTTTVATRGTIVPQRQLGGFIAPAQNVLVSSSLSEPALSVNVVEGQHVRKGDVLATLDVADIEATYQADVHAALEADANASKQVFAGAQTIGTGQRDVTAAAATLAQAKQKLQLDQLNLDRYAQLLKQGYIAQQTQDAQAQTVAGDTSAVSAAQAGLRTAQLTANTNGTQSTGLQGASVDALREAAAQAHATARQVAAQIARATITSPVDGVVTNRNLNPGEYPGTRTLFTIQALSTVYAELNASSEQLAGARVGNSATVTQHGGAAAQRGKIVAILGQAAPGSTNFTIKVALDNATGAFLAGMAVDTDVQLTPVSGTQVPLTAFSGGTETALGVVDGGTYRSVSVTVIAETTNDAVVTGIAPGTRIVTDGTSLADGQKVAVR
jgi:multidrug efflux pump subunit AcrA (membrane-fusion protein)